MITLRKTSDWDTWLSTIQTRARLSGIWDLVNPTSPLQPTHLPPPTRPPTDSIESATLRIQFGLDLLHYERQQEALRELNKNIHSTISAQNALWLRTEVGDADPWSVLRGLRDRLAPTDEARVKEIKRRYGRVCKGPGNREVEAWVMDWQAAYTWAKVYDVGDIMVGNRPQRDFLMAVSAKERMFAAIHLGKLEKLEEGQGSDVYELIESFRFFLRMMKPIDR